MDEIEIKKDLLPDKYNDYASKGWKKLFDAYDKFDNEKEEANMDIFYFIEIKIDKLYNQRFRNFLKIIRK